MAVFELLESGYTKIDFTKFLKNILWRGTSANFIQIPTDLMKSRIFDLYLGSCEDIFECCFSQKTNFDETNYVTNFGY